MKDLHSNFQVFSKILVISILLFFLTPNAAFAKQAVLKRIVIDKDRLRVRLFVSRKTPLKVIQVEKKEILIALKDVTVQKGFKIKGKNASHVKHIAVEKLPGNVFAVVLTGKTPYHYLRSNFNKSDSSFVIDLEKKTKPDKPAAKQTTKEKKAVSPVKKVPKSDKLTKIQPDKKSEQASSLKTADKKKTDKKKDATKSPQKPAEKKIRLERLSNLKIPKVRKKGPYGGDINDILKTIDPNECSSNQFDNIMVLLKKELFNDASDILEKYVDEDNFICLEQAYYLRAYAFFMGTEPEDFVRLIKADTLFQEALVSYPKSDLAPFAYASLGLIHTQLRNSAIAEGYYNIVKQGYAEYPGMPEIMYHLARIYDDSGYNDKALRYYKTVFEDPIRNAYIPDAGIGYGKALFDKKQYIDSLAILDWVINTNASKVYDSPELLLYMGNAHFEVGHNKLARETLTRLLNLFPGIDKKDTILSRIGDSYGMDNNVEKAKKIYEYVIDKYPDGEGFIISSIGIARYLTNK
ncbi:MAG: tetratricopeptide repeat protein, partial [Desulfobacteraceae bacterium]|nr:tetratricopeptide repeat protein [Desulfobacteraceae bacterium]